MPFRVMGGGVGTTTTGAQPSCWPCLARGSEQMLMVCPLRNPPPDHHQTCSREQLTCQHMGPVEDTWTQAHMLPSHATPRNGAPWDNMGWQLR